ncbi:MAG: sugar phosphate isomerase/epimerase family protein [Planctomycetaceae bacterium]
MSIGIGINMEYVRHVDKPFEEGIRIASELGFEYVEPNLLNGRDLMAEAGYYHFVSMDEDPLEVRALLDEHGVKPSGVSAHVPLRKPEISIPYLTRAIRFAKDLGAPVVVTDEGQRPDGFTDEEMWTVAKYSLQRVLPWAERHGIKIGLEPHKEWTTRPDTLLRLLSLVDSPMLGVNFDTGNAYLSGTDPYKFLDIVKDRVVYLHAKDISIQQSEAERGKVTGTPVGCACGEGLIDWARVIEILRGARYEGVLSVECGTQAQAASSLKHLRPLLKEAGRV